MAAELKPAAHNWKRNFSKFLKGWGAKGQSIPAAPLRTSGTRMQLPSFSIVRTQSWALWQALIVCLGPPRIHLSLEFGMTEAFELSCLAEEVCNYRFGSGAGCGKKR
ncbi:hypothetical protein CDAR_399131 [Caerostris darwini]|uniref:Uncharacterized protein n=1 Tax=Caerostris darwini TaxID=1538125 RepID=A0AAV4SXE7_9ARAC|nr:hypothetical protein CDAR_399131 [Caerostris darwini]